MSNLYFRGIHEIVPKNFEIDINNKKYICDGVMLMNLELIRKDNIYKKFRSYYIRFYKKKKYFGDQHIINALFADKIGFLPPKFGIWFIDDNTIKAYLNLKPKIYNLNELRLANLNPVIRHLWGKTKEGILEEKPWLLRKYFKIKKDWNYFANKTGYYSSICKYYKNACIYKY